MIIYTGIGDKGKTSLYDGLDVPKTDLRIQSVGDLDELVSFIGMARTTVKQPRILELLHEVQRDLFDAGAEIATQNPELLKKRIETADWQRLEGYIDELLEGFEIPEYFILPGDKPDAAILHVCRSVCRRLERTTVALNSELNDDLNKDLMIFINRLSDLLYAMSRFVEESCEKVLF